MGDRELIERYLSGEETAIEDLIVKYQRRIYALAYRMTGNMEESKDITQNTFLKAIKNIRKFRGESLFKTWLYKIAYNLCLNYIKKARHHQEELQHELVGNQAGALGVLIEKERNMHIKKALSKVPGRQRETIILRTFEGLSCQEVTEIMNISEGAVKANYHHGIKKLKEVLREHGYETES
jgi:RNA polymerase sigma-70 factor (ECF subfamily)